MTTEKTLHRSMVVGFVALDATSGDIETSELSEANILHPKAGSVDKRFSTECVPSIRVVARAWMTGGRRSRDDAGAQGRVLYRLCRRSTIDAPGSMQRVVRRVRRHAVAGAAS
jgi:hypothetical protein